MHVMPQDMHVMPEDEMSRELIHQIEVLTRRYKGLSLRPRRIWRYHRFIITRNYDNDLNEYIRNKNLYYLVSSGPIKHYHRIVGYLQTDTDCMEFELSDGSFIESFVDYGDTLEGIYVKTFKIDTSSAAGGGRKTRRKLN